MATYTIRPSVQQDWRDTAMSKAQFNAVAAERRANRAGSGFDEFGKSYNISTGHPSVNEGLWVGGIHYPNKFALGREGTDSIGSSKSNLPIANVNGVVCKLAGYDSLATNAVSLPPAPTILPHTATLTPEQIASGVVKHADASNSGLIVNGKFDTDTSGWTNFLGTLTRTSEGVLVTSAGAERIGGYTVISTVVGKTYKIEFLCKRGTAEPHLRVGNGVNSFNLLNMVIANALDFTKVEYSFVANSSNTYISLCVNGSSAGSTAYFDNIAVFPADAISRSDLVFLESWHEDVSEKDFVYPLGNVQYLGTTGDAGTPVNGAFAGFGTYSLFGNWQASGALIGKGYVWSSLSDANKKAFVANPENNCYLDGDKVIQVRYRVRVVQGLGDSWTNVSDTNTRPYYNSSITQRLLPRGKLVSRTDIGVYNQDSIIGWYDPYNTVSGDTYFYPDGNIGSFKAASAIASKNSMAYEGKCYALPIALVHRRNQGAYHPVYNPNGTKLNGSGLAWHTASTTATSIAHTFAEDMASGTTAGTIAGTSTRAGRPDGLFYDQVHESDILDLRNSSQKVEDYNRLIAREFNKAVAGSTRGAEGEYISSYCPTTMTSSLGTWGTTANYGVTSRSVYAGVTHVSSNTFYESKQVGGVYDLVFVRNTTSGNVYKALSVKYFTNATYIYFDHSYGTTFTDVASPYDVILIKSSTRTKSNTLTHTDIIGSPANYPTTWKESGVSGTPLIVAEDGTSLLPTGALTTFKLSHKANATPLQVLRSTDSGATWTALTVTTHYTFSTTTNAITMVTAPATTDLIMVAYQTKTNMAVPAVNSEVLAIGDVQASSFSSVLVGAHLSHSLLGKTPIESSGVRHTIKTVLLEKSIDNTSKFVLNPFWYPTHSVLTLNNLNTPAVKVFPYLTRSNGKAYLQLVFKEMKYDVDWGDDSKFNIVDNVSTTVDDNGQTVLVGQKRIELPYFIGAAE